MTTKASNAETTTPEKQILHLLSSHGIQPTQQRRAIAMILFARHQHLTADQLFEQVNAKKVTMSRATVYNNLGLFVEKGLLTEIHLDPERVFYDTNTGLHHHIYNLDTGEFLDVTLDALAPLIPAGLAPKGTQIEEVSIVIKVRNKTTGLLQ